MILTALLGLVLIGIVVSWVKRLPRPGERFVELSRQRQFMTVLAFPVGVGVMAASTAVLAVAEYPQPASNYGALLLILLLIGALGGFGYLVVTAALRTARALRRHDPGRSGEP